LLTIPGNSSGFEEDPSFEDREFLGVFRYIHPDDLIIVLVFESKDVFAG